MCTKLPIHGNCLLEHYELCPHRLRVRVVTTYNKREPPVRLQNITHLERLGNKPISQRTQYCIWSDMDLRETESKFKTKIPLQKCEQKQPTKATNVSNKESLIWIFKPCKPLYQSKTNIHEFTKENLCCKLQDQHDITTTATTVSYVHGTKSDSKNFKLKRTLSKTLIDTDKNKKPLFWQNAKINKLLTKSVNVENAKAIGTTFTEIIGFDNIKKGERYAGGADKPNIKFFPAYSSTSASSQLSVHDKPKVKKALSKRVRSTANKKVPNKNTAIKSKILSQHQKMNSVISSQGNETQNSLPFLTHDCYRNVKKQSQCPVVFNLNTTCKTSQKKDLRGNVLKRN